MKIDNSIKGLPGSGNTTPTPRATTPPATVASTPSPVGAQVELSRTATRLLKGGEDFNAARVAEIRQAISEGKFQVNPERIADGLLDSVREFLADRRQPSA